MKFLNKIFKQFSNQQHSANVDKESSAQQSNTYSINEEDVPLSVKYLDIDKDELFRILDNKENDDEILTTTEKKNLEDEGWSYLQRILESERNLGRSMAIEELVNNNYKTLSIKSGNPWKEPIDFTLKYFEQYIFTKSHEAEIQLKFSFPIMHEYIQRHIFKEQTIIPFNTNFEEQEAYQEFLVFIKLFYLSFYPDKDIRDKQIKHDFKTINNELINFIQMD